MHSSLQLSGLAMMQGTPLKKMRTTSETAPEGSVKTPRHLRGGARCLGTRREDWRAGKACPDAGHKAGAICRPCYSANRSTSLIENSNCEGLLATMFPVRLLGLNSNCSTPRRLPIVKPSARRHFAEARLQLALMIAGMTGYALMAVPTEAAAQSAPGTQLSGDQYPDLLDGTLSASRRSGR